MQSSPLTWAYLIIALSSFALDVRISSHQEVVARAFTQVIASRGRRFSGNVTSNYALIFDGKSDGGIIAYADSDWASDPITRKSTTGYLVKLANGIFCWNSRAQKSIALSSTEAEYMSLCDTSRQLVWIRSLLSELGINLAPIPLCGDNQGSIFLSSNPVQEKRIKHIDLRHHYIHEVICDKKIELFFIEGAENPADLFTKNLGRIKFLKFREQLGLEFYSP